MTRTRGWPGFFFFPKSVILVLTAQIIIKTVESEFLTMTNSLSHGQHKMIQGREEMWRSFQVTTPPASFCTFHSFIKETGHNDGGAVCCLERNH